MLFACSLTQAVNTHSCCRWCGCSYRCLCLCRYRCCLCRRCLLFMQPASPRVSLLTESLRQVPHQGCRNCGLPSRATPERSANLRRHWWRRERHRNHASPPYHYEVNHDKTCKKDILKYDISVALNAGEHEKTTFSCMKR